MKTTLLGSVILVIGALLPVGCESPSGSSAAPDAVDAVEVSRPDATTDAKADDAQADAEESSELTIVEDIPVAFDDMQAGVVETATIELEDLRNEPVYANMQPQPACGSLDPAASFIRIEALAGGPATLSYEVGVAPRGAAQFTRLATFSGTVAAGDQIPMSADGFVLDGAGRALVSQVLLGSEPALSIRIAASVADDVDDLEVAASLSFHLSSLAHGCP